MDLINPEMQMPWVMGEMGSCHEEILGNALQLVEVAAQAGCNAAKAQFWSSPHRMRERRHLDGSGAYDQGSIRYQWLGALRDQCHALGISFACSVYLPEDVAELSKFVDVFKVASFEAQDLELIGRILGVKGDRPLFISTGMQGAHDARPTKSEEAIYLHCVSAYPCPLEEASLGAIEPHEGYSDHTRCVYTGGLAVASGADYLEVHYRLAPTRPTCPDYVVALAPDQLKAYVEFARTAAEMRGSGEKIIQPSEEVNRKHIVHVS